MPNPQNLIPWKKGQSGNPAGTNRRARITRALEDLIKSTDCEKELAAIWLGLAKTGDKAFFSMLLDRLEGKVKDSAAIDQDEDEAAPRIVIPGADERG